MDQIFNSLNFITNLNEKSPQKEINLNVMNQFQPMNFVQLINLQNLQINENIQQVQSDIGTIFNSLDKLEQKISSFNLPYRKHPKKQRRKADQINKIFQCQDCQRSYGSEISLNLHRKIKHKQMKKIINTQLEQLEQISKQENDN